MPSAKLARHISCRSNIKVGAERIRDKIAASKAKGMWMGGGVPLGYEAKDRKLVVVPDEVSDGSCGHGALQNEQFHTNASGRTSQ